MATALENVLASENRTEHAKIYIEPTLKKAIQIYANSNGLSFSEAGRKIWLLAFDLAICTVSGESVEV